MKKLIALGLILILAVYAQAATKIWVSTDGNWGTAASWSPSGVPANNDNVYLEDSAVSVTAGFSQSAVYLASLNIAQSYTGYVGDDVNYLSIGAVKVEIGYNNGPGSPAGSQRINLNLDANCGSVVINDSGSPYTSTIPTILIKDINASSTLEVRKGKVGVAFKTGEVSTFSTITAATGSEVTIGSGTTLTTYKQTGGDNTLLCAATTVTVDGGTLLINGTGAITTLTTTGGTVISNTSGVITTATTEILGTLDLTKSTKARTITTCKLDSGGTLKYDPSVITLTNKVSSDAPVALKATRP
jgi:fibronectin-binding autotransporter adhesin